MNHVRRAGQVPAPVAALEVQARASAEEIYNLMQDTMHEAMQEIRELYGWHMAHLVMMELGRLESEATIAGGWLA